MQGLKQLPVLYITIKRSVHHASQLLLVRHIQNDFKQTIIVIDSQVTGIQRCPCGNPSCGTISLLRIIQKSRDA